MRSGSATELSAYAYQCAIKLTPLSTRQKLRFRAAARSAESGQFFRHTYAVSRLRRAAGTVCLSKQNLTANWPRLAVGRHSCVLMGELRTTRKGLTRMTLTDAENTPASIYDGVCLDQWGTGGDGKVGPFDHT